MLENRRNTYNIIIEIYITESDKYILLLIQSFPDNAPAYILKAEVLEVPFLRKMRELRYLRNGTSNHQNEKRRPHLI